MGREIDQSAFSAEDHAQFRERLREETSLLRHWFDDRAFAASDAFTSGVELEGWLVDADRLPAPRNDEFLEAANDPDIVAELSRFNFEINAPPHDLTETVLSKTHQDLEERWRICRQAAERLGLTPLSVGILPTVREDMLTLDWMSDSNRYRALNEAILARRKGRTLPIQIEGEDRLSFDANSIMLEAACTSLQTHLKINQDDAARFYNASVIAAGPLVAASANSPYLYGKSLWAETRVPAFEQATALEGFPDAQGRNMLRVTLGCGYVRRSLLELFLENLSYPVLLPALEDQHARLPHLKLQNGTIWRWVRPILGFDGDTPHLRIEHRVAAAGPSMADNVAQLALTHGLTLALARAETPPETLTPFEDARANFYACAREGLDAEVRWEGASVNVQTLLHDHLAPLARNALASLGLDARDLTYYFDDVLLPRLMSGRNGAHWQRSFTDCNGPRLQDLTEAYAEWQAGGLPVHEWSV